LLTLVADHLHDLCLWRLFLAAVFSFGCDVSNVFCTGQQTLIGSSETDAAAEEHKDVQSSQLVSSRNKFVWPGIDAILEAYAIHAEGDDSF